MTVTSTQSASVDLNTHSTGCAQGRTWKMTACALHAASILCTSFPSWVFTDSGACPSAEAALGIMVFLPRNTDLAQLSAALPGDALCEVERVVLNGFLKAITVYIGVIARTH